MKTEELVTMLAAQATPVPAHAARRYLARALLAGVPATLALLMGTLGLRPDLGQALAHADFWLKQGYALVLAGAALMAAHGLARPGARWRHAAWGLVLPPLLLATLAVAVLVQADPQVRPGLLLGSTWRECPFNIGVLALPLLGAMLLALKRLAPVHPAWAGGVAGLAAGSLAAAAYALHCPETAAPFIALWYSAGILLSALLGLLSGWRWLRW